MEIHDHLYALGLRLGREVFDDADGFRGALDDFLDESAASTGDINLLVDAVRLGAYQALISMLDSGADAHSAVEEAGARLARDRGSADVDSARWACAVLGFAIGRVGDPEVRRYRSATPSSGPQPAATQLPPAPPTQFPGQPHAQSPAPTFPPPAYQSPPSAPPAPSGQPAGSQAGPGSYPAQPSWQQPSPYPGQPSWQSPSPQKKSKTVPIVAAVVAVLVIVGGIVAGVLLSGGGDDQEADPGGGGSEDPTSSETTADLTPSAVAERYSALGTAITTGVAECTPGALTSGQTENLSCTVSSGADPTTLTLVTYESAATLEATRDRTVDLSGSYGGMYLEQGGDVVYGFDAAQVDDDSVQKSSVYWDDTAAVQSAVLEGGSGDDALDELTLLYRTVSAPLTYPAKPTDSQLVAFLERVNNLGQCERIPTLTGSETEENRCDGPMGIVAYYGKFTDRAALDGYRDDQNRFTRDDGGKPDKWYLTASEGDNVGNLNQYFFDSDDGSSDQAVIYWDDPGCLCYGQAYLPGRDSDKLYDWWANN